MLLDRLEFIRLQQVNGDKADLFASFAEIVELDFAVTPFARAVIDAARNRLPKSTGELLELALPRKGPRSRWERPEQYEMDFVRFGAAMRVLPFSFLPFGSLGEPTRGEALPPDVQKAFDESRRRFAGHEVLLAAVEQICTHWTEKEYDDADEAPAVPLRIKRSLVGTFTVELNAESVD